MGWLLLAMWAGSLGLAPPLERGTNLLRNPGFEAAGDWQPYGRGGTLDESVAHRGKRSLRLSAAGRDEVHGMVQELVLAQPVRHPFRVAAWSRAEGAQEGEDYDVYLDVFYEDGPPLWGVKARCATGTHDWQRVVAEFEPAKPVRRIQVFLLLRHAAGTVWFDDVELELIPFALADLRTAAGVRGGQGLAALSARSSLAVQWRAGLWRGDREVAQAQGRGHDIAATFGPLQPGPATLRLEATDVWRGERLARDEPLEVTGAPPPPLVWTAPNLAQVGPLAEPPDTAPQSLELAAARGGHDAGQVVLRSLLPWDDIQVVPGALVGPAGAQLPAACWSVRRVACVDDVPDVLLPPAAELAALHTQPYRLTLAVPPDAAPGRYTGSVLVRAGRELRLPVTAQVWPLTLPARPSVPAVFGLWRGMFRQRYGLQPDTAACAEAQHRWYQMLMDYRLAPYHCEWQAEPNHQAWPAPWPVGDPRTDAVLADPRLPAFGLPYPLGDEPALRRELAHLAERGWLDRGFYYLWDEPTRQAQYARIRAWAARIHAVEPRARVLITYYRGPEDGPHLGDLDAVPGELGPDVDILCTSEWALRGQDDYGRRLAAKLRPGQQWWVYVCGGSDPAVNLHLSNNGVLSRAVMWMVYRQQAAGFLYWALNAIGAGERPDAPFAWRKGLVPGDGVLVYPGEAFGVAGPLPSVRLERWRDGAEDLELLRLVEARHGRPAAEALVGRVYHGPTAVERDPATVEAWRRELAQAAAR